MKFNLGVTSRLLFLHWTTKEGKESNHNMFQYKGIASHGIHTRVNIDTFIVNVANWTLKLTKAYFKAYNS